MCFTNKISDLCKEIEREADSKQREINNMFSFVNDIKKVCEKYETETCAQIKQIIFDSEDLHDINENIQPNKKEGKRGRKGNSTYVLKLEPNGVVSYVNGNKPYKSTAEAYRNIFNKSDSSRNIARYITNNGFYINGRYILYYDIENVKDIIKKHESGMNDNKKYSSRVGCFARTDNTEYKWYSSVTSAIKNMCDNDEVSKGKIEKIRTEVGKGKDGDIFKFTVKNREITIKRADQKNI